MKQALGGTIVGSLLILLLLLGCAGHERMFHRDGNDLETVFETLDNRIVQLTTNIERLEKQTIALKQIPPPPDPALRELRELDLAGWRLHQQQWMLQREHLRFTRAQLQRVLEAPEHKPELLAQWTRQVQQYQVSLGALRQQRQGLEEQYVQVEAKVMEQYLR